MSSGKYGAVSGAIGRMQMMDNISEHLASVKSTAYKRGQVRFEAVLGEANSGMASKAVNYARTTGEVIDFTPGQLEYTGNPLNVAINGDGFFQVECKDGSRGYIRRGSFQLDTKGQLVDPNKRPVLDVAGKPIVLLHSDIDISTDGWIYADGVQVAQIGFYQFDDNSVLQRAGEGLFKPSDGSKPKPNPDSQIIQKNIETSNVSMMQEVARMTTNTRTFEAAEKALKVYNDMDGYAAQLGLVQ